MTGIHQAKMNENPGPQSAGANSTNQEYPRRLTTLVLTGFMGVGKTTVGRILAARGGLQWLDTDRIIGERFGLSVAEMFLRDGETRLRECEATICRELADRDGLLITTGGGTLLRRENVAVFQERALIICLTAREDTIACRLAIEDETRPLFGQDWWRLLAARQPVYENFAHRVATDGLHAQQVADEVWQIWVKANQRG